MENSLSPKERIQKLVLYLDISVRALAQLVEMSEATMYHITDGTYNISPRTASRIAYQLEKKKGVIVNRDWLLTGKGEMVDEKLSVPMGEPRVRMNVSCVEDEGDEYAFVNYKEKYLALLEKYTALLESKA